VKLAKEQIVAFFMARGDIGSAEQADGSLPDPVDLRDDADALRALGMNPALLATQIDNLEI
jgi:hypothetical protein